MRISDWSSDVCSSDLEHLVSAAQSDDQAAAPMMGENVDVPALAAQRGEIRDGCLGPRQDDDRRLGRDGTARRNPSQLDAGFELEGIAVVEVGAAGQEDRKSVV